MTPKQPETTTPKMLGFLGPGMDLDRSGVIEVIRAAFEAGIEVQVNRRNS